jgi:hypothetical protein
MLINLGFFELIDNIILTEENETIVIECLLSLKNISCSGGFIDITKISSLGFYKKIILLLSNCYYKEKTEKIEVIITYGLEFLAKSIIISDGILRMNIDFNDLINVILYGIGMNFIQKDKETLIELLSSITYIIDNEVDIQRTFGVSVKK